MNLQALALAVGLLTSTALQAQPEAVVGSTLEDFFTAAVNYSPALQAARARWDIGEARVDVATGQLLPQVSATANVSDNSRTANARRQDFTGERYALQLSQVLFSWQAFEARRQASLLESQSEAEYYAQLAELLTVVADDYLTALQAEDALRSINSELEATRNQVNQIQQFYNLQLARITDLYDGQARAAAVETQRIDAESVLTIERANLQASSGIAVGGLSRLPEAITVTPLEGSLEDWLARAQSNNKRIEARDFALQAAQRAVSQQRGAYLPRVSLVVQQSTTNTGFDNFPLDRADINYIGVDVSVPLFAGGSNRAQVRAAESQRNIAESELRMTSLEIQDRARTAYFQVKAGESRIEAARLLAESTATASAAMQRGYELGTVTSVDVLNALRDQFRAQRDLQKARYDLMRWTLALYRDAGTLSADDMQRMSNQLNAPALPPPGSGSTPTATRAAPPR